MCKAFYYLLAVVGVMPAVPVAAQTNASSNSIATDPPLLNAEFGIGLSPTIGKPISSDADDSLVDDSEYELSLRVWRAVNHLKKMRVQIKIGVTDAPNYLDGDNPESTAYGELQIGDTYIPFRELLKGEFGSPVLASTNAIRPYARYRLVSVHEDFLQDRTRTDHKFTLGVRYRRVPYVMDDPEVPGLYVEGRAEVTRAFSTSDPDEFWNPTLRLDVYSPPFWMDTRFVATVAGDANFYAHTRAPDGDKRRDLRLRTTIGFDVTEPLKRLLGISGIRGELFGRFQRRWSNDSQKEHTRLYFLPSVSLSAAIK